MEENLKFKDPVEMLLMIDDNLLNGDVDLYRWQVQVLRDFAKPSTAQNPYKATLLAANGSGKDRFILAPAGVWLGSSFEESSSIFTSSSGVQLDAQLGLYVQNLALAYNRILGEDCWVTNYRRMQNAKTKSVVREFATDEPGKAEGYHPINANSQFAIFVSEAKSIPDTIFKALTRCTGFTKRLDVSSPGVPSGFFYNACTSDRWKHYHVTAFDCPHLLGDYIDEVKEMYGGEESELYKSMILAEFAASDEPIVMQYHTLNRLLQLKIPHFQETYNHAGLDLAAGRDETVLYVRNGNKVIGREVWRLSDTADLTDKIDEALKRWDLKNDVSRISADAGGLGKPILDQLRRRGWENIRYILNNAKPYDPRAYVNRGSELWFKFKKLVDKYEVVLPRDEKTIKQLASRYYVFKEQRLKLESKIEARAKGRSSPDRGDALVLCFANYHSPDIIPSNKLIELQKAAVQPVKLHPFNQHTFVSKKIQRSPFLPRFVGRTLPNHVVADLEEFNRKNQLRRESDNYAVSAEETSR